VEELIILGGDEKTAKKLHSIRSFHLLSLTGKGVAGFELGKRNRGATSMGSRFDSREHVQARKRSAETGKRGGGTEETGHRSQGKKRPISWRGCRGLV